MSLAIVAKVFATLSSPVTNVSNSTLPLPHSFTDCSTVYGPKLSLDSVKVVPAP
jgi:hypothetical protein